MSDAKLRDLERRWKETGSPDDEAAYLLERVRVGDLSREKLELAAYCGHEGATRAVGQQNVVSPDDLGAWVRALHVRSVEAVARVCVAVARAAGPLQEDVRPWEVAPATVLQRTEECIISKNRESATQLRLAALRMPGNPDTEPELLLVAGAASLAVPDDPQVHLDHLARRLQHFADRVGAFMIFGAALREVAPWALGIGDAIRERVLARAGPGGAGS